MAFIEEQLKGGKKYYYLTQTVRAAGKFKKVRVLLTNTEIGKSELEKLAKSKQKELKKQITDAKKSIVFFSVNVDNSKISQKHLVWERPCRLYLVYIAGDALEMPQIKEFGRGWGMTYCFFRNNMIKVVWGMKQFIKSGICIINNMMDNDYFDRKIKRYDRLTKKLLEAYKKADNIKIEKLSEKQFLGQYKEFCSIFLDWWGFAQVAEPIAYGAEYLLKEKIPEKVFSVITSPSQKSYTMIEEEKLLKIALKVKQNKKALKLFENDAAEIKKQLYERKNEKYFHEIRELLEQHVKDYFWLKNNYFEAKDLEIEYFIEEIKNIIKENIEINNILGKNNIRLDEIRQNKAEIINKLSLEDRYKKLVKLVDFFCIFQDERKAISLKGHHYLALLIKEAARRTGINENLLYSCTTSEITLVLKGRFDINILRKRQQHCTLIITKHDNTLLAGKESQDKEREILGSEQKDEITEFEGMRAQGGKVIGKVIKILDPRDAGRFKQGSILVTTMTSPDFITIMKKAAAIITDEGGITSHASIVAREFGIPCVIATKIATNVLNDGDKVEVNANHGVVKILERL